MKRQVILRNEVTTDGVVGLLNEALALDSDAMNKLIHHREPCNKALAEHPTIQVGAMNGSEISVGIVGLLNGMFGYANDGIGAISAEYNLECPDGHDLLDGVSSGQKCLECDKKIVLGKLYRFSVIRKAGD